MAKVAKTTKQCDVTLVIRFTYCTNLISKAILAETISKVILAETATWLTKML